jgi:hypothetical protein
MKLTGKKRKIEFIYWFAYYHLDSPSVRYRAKYPLDYAHTHLNIDSRLVIPGYTPKRILLFLKAYFSALWFRKKNSLIVIQRLRSNFIYATLLKLLVLLQRKHTVYDLDDADYLERHPPTIYYFIRNCHYVTAGSQLIRKHLLPLNPNTFHLTSPIPDLQIAKNGKSKIFTIGWVGGYAWGHKESLLRFVFPAIKNLSFPCKLILLGVTKASDRKQIRDYFQFSSKVSLQMPQEVDWNNETQLQEEISQFDIGIATLLNTPVQIAKSGIKAKQYLNVGIPVLCNDLAENNRLIRHGYNGYLCDSPLEFQRRLNQFYHMSEQVYQQFSLNALSSVKPFHCSAYFEELEHMLQATTHHKLRLAPEKSPGKINMKHPG